MNRRRPVVQLRMSAASHWQPDPDHETLPSSCNAAGKRSEDQPVAADTTGKSAPGDFSGAIETYRKAQAIRARISDTSVEFLRDRMSSNTRIAGWIKI